MLSSILHYGYNAAKVNCASCIVHLQSSLQAKHFRAYDEGRLLTALRERNHQAALVKHYILTRIRKATVLLLKVVTMTLQQQQNQCHLRQRTSKVTTRYKTLRSTLHVSLGPERPQSLDAEQLLHGLSRGVDTIETHDFVFRIVPLGQPEPLGAF